MQKKSPFSLTNIGFYLFLIIASIVAVTKFGELEKVFVSFTQVNPWLLILAVGFQAMTYVCNAFVLYDLTKIFNKNFLFVRKDFFQCSIISLFLNQTVPTAGVSGNSFVVYYLAKKGVDIKESFSVLFLELFTFYSARLTIILLIFSYFTLSFTDKISGLFFTLGFLGIFIFCLLLFILMFLGNRKIVYPLLNWVKKYKLGVWIIKKIKAGFKFSNGYDWESPWNILKNKKKQLLYPFLWQIGLFLCDTLTIHLLFVGLGLHLSIIKVALGLITAQIISMVSITPGALIFFEGGMTLFYTLLGVPAGGAFIVTILYRALSFWLPMPIGLVLYKKLSNHNGQKPPLAPI